MGSMLVMLSALNTTTSSMRLMNSGRNVARNALVDGLLHGLLVAVLGELADELRAHVATS